MNPTTLCSHCSNPLPNDGLTRKRQRARRCSACNNQAALDRRRNDPIRRLQHKLQNNIRKHWPAAPSTLWSRESVEYIFNRFDQKCALTGETDSINLCIVSAIKTEVPPTRDQLIVLSIRAAMQLSRKDNDKRIAKFSDEVKAKLGI